MEQSFLFDMADALLASDAGKALHMLDDIVRGVTKGLTVPAVLYYFTRWATDLVRVKSGLDPLFFPLEANTLARQASGASEEKLLALYDDLLERNRHSEHPLNVKNVTEALCLHLVVALS